MVEYAVKFVKNSYQILRTNSIRNIRLAALSFMNVGDKVPRLYAFSIYTPDAAKDLGR
ncbi:hypothetical protein SAMN06296008_1149 [Polynucleobacter kasalickyi]|uniref:Uncharacterized protein n=1 Tax=Polynucleobacter kasalickyi TaxID=1938817 RepID=A0A1W2BLV6_9BURK|nr:hypothetical protein SAMN06296008_1149 [Polynucleobacter kasalickyi]